MIKSICICCSIFITTINILWLGLKKKDSWNILETLPLCTLVNLTKKLKCCMNLISFFNFKAVISFYTFTPNIKLTNLEATKINQACFQKLFIVNDFFLFSNCKLHVALPLSLLVTRKFLTVVYIWHFIWINNLRHKKVGCLWLFTAKVIFSWYQ